MNNMFRITTRCIALVLIIVFITACGSKKNPTGGPQDIVKPVVLGSSPAEFGEINKGLIEVSFSKEMDKTSLANSIYIYPPVLNKKFSLDGPTLKIKLNETLKLNTNYYVTLSTRLKDSRGNPLEKNQTLVFRNGELNNTRVSGAITYELPSDIGLPVELNVLSADSLLVLSNRISGETYSIEALNPQTYILRAYIDKNLNGRYDFGLDPTFEGKSDGAPVSNVNINIAYADSTQPKIRKVLAVSNRELLVNLSEPIKSFKSMNILSTVPVAIKHYLLEQDKISILSTVMDSTEYTLQLIGVEDFKGNKSDMLETKFRNAAKPDTTPPAVTFSNPRNGASVDNLLPVLEVHFSELIPPDKVFAQLSAGKDIIPIEKLPGFGRIYRFQPTKQLINYSTHTLKILTSTADISGNKLTQEYSLQFLPLKRDK